MDSVRYVDAARRPRAGTARVRLLQQPLQRGEVQDSLAGEVGMR